MEVLNEGGVTRLKWFAVLCFAGISTLFHLIAYQKTEGCEKVRLDESLRKLVERTHGEYEFSYLICKGKKKRASKEDQPPAGQLPAQYGGLPTNIPPPDPNTTAP